MIDYGFDMGDRRPVLWWLAAAGILLAAYGLCLRFLFPGYLHPFWPTHDDFYLYASMGELTWTQLAKFPRPVAYDAMKVLGTFGLTGVMAGSIALALVNLLLILGLARRLLSIRSPWDLLSVALFSLLVCAHPQFYFDHRHDLPAQTSLLFLLLAFWAWLYWVQGRRAPWLIAAAISTVLFAFAKETYFVSAVIALFALAVADRRHRRAHACFLCFVLASEIASLGWARYVNGPFIDPGADQTAAYRMSLAPADLLRTYAYYLAHALNPALALWIAACLACAWRNRGQFWTAAAFVAAGLGVFVPHAVLPNHKIAEYAWAAVPFFLAPTFLVLPALAGLMFPWRGAAAIAMALLVVWSCAGYQRRYRSPLLRWGVEQERLGGKLVQSFSELDSIPRGARVLVAGVETAFIPWSSPFYIRGRFGGDRQWTVIVKPDRPAAPSDPLCRLATARFVRLSDYDVLVTYGPDGRLASIRHKPEFTGADRSQDLELLVPDVAAVARQAAAARPQTYGAWMAAARASLEWGLWDEALRFLERAQPMGGASDPLWRLYAARAYTGLGQAAEAERQLAGLNPSDEVSELRARIDGLRTSVQAALVAIPPFIAQPDAHGLGMVELKWTAAAGLRTEIHVNAPDGPLLTSGGAMGEARTENWVKDGTEFFLQDVTEGKPLTPDFTLARVRVGVARR